MRILVLIVLMFLTIPAYGQEAPLDLTNKREARKELKKDKPKKNLFKEFYNDFFKYSTIYAAGDYRAPYESSNKNI